MPNKGLIRECWDFLKIRKVWWMTPILVLLLLLGLIILWGQTSAVSSFVYVLF